MPCPEKRLPNANVRMADIRPIPLRPLGDRKAEPGKLDCTRSPSFHTASAERGPMIQPRFACGGRLERIPQRPLILEAA